MVPQIQVDGVRRRKNIWTVPSSGTLDFVRLDDFSGCVFAEQRRFSGWQKCHGNNVKGYDT